MTFWSVSGGKMTRHGAIASYFLLFNSQKKFPFPIRKIKAKSVRKASGHIVGNSYRLIKKISSCHLSRWEASLPDSVFNVKKDMDLCMGRLFANKTMVVKVPPKIFHSNFRGYFILQLRFLFAVSTAEQEQYDAQNHAWAQQRENGFLHRGAPDKIIKRNTCEESDCKGKDPFQNFVFHFF